MSDLRLDISSNTAQADTAIAQLTAKIANLSAAIKQLNSTGASSAITGSLASQLRVAQEQMALLNGTSSQLIKNWQNVGETSSRAFRAMRGEIFEVNNALREQDRITRAGTYGGRLVQQSPQNLFGNLTPQIQEHASRARDLEQAFGGVALGGKHAAQGIKEVSESSNLATTGMRSLITVTDEVERGQRGQIVASIGRLVKELPAQAQAAAVAIGAIGIAGYAAIRGAAAMGQLGEATRTSAMAAGMSIPAYSALRGVLELMGLKTNEADANLRHFAVAVEQAADVSSAAARAFHQIGITQDQINAAGGNVGKMFDMVVQAMGRYANDANKVAVATELFGRGFEKILPAISEGSDHFEQMRTKAQQLGLVLTEDMVKSLADTKDKIELLSAGIEGRAIKAFLNWKPAIDSVIDALNRLVGVGSTAEASLTKFENTAKVVYARGGLNRSPTDLGIGPIAEPSEITTGARGGSRRTVPAIDQPYDAKAFLHQLQSATAPSAGVLAGQPNTMQELTNKLLAENAKLAQQGGANKNISQRIDQNTIKFWQDASKNAGLSPKDRDEAQNKANEAIIQSMKLAGSGGGGAVKAQWAEISAAERNALNQVKGDAPAMQAVIADWTAKAEAQFPKGSIAFKRAMDEIQKASQQAATVTIDQIEKMSQALRRGNEDILRGFEAGIKGQVQQGKLSPGQAAGFDVQEIYKSNQPSIDANNKIMSNPKANSQQQQDAWWRNWDIGEKMQGQIEIINEEFAKLGREAADKFAKPFRETLGKIGSSIETGIINALEHNTSGQKLGKALMDSAISGTVHLGGDILSKIGGGLLHGKEGEGFSEVLGNKLAMFVANQLSQLGILSVIAANTGVAAAGSTVGAAEGAAGAAGAAGGFLSGIKSLFGTLLSFAPAAAHGWDVPSFAGGGWSIPGGLSMLHAREMVLPENLADRVRNMTGGNGGGGGQQKAGDNHFHAHFEGPSDAPSTARMFRSFIRKNPNDLMAAAAKMHF